MPQRPCRADSKLPLIKCKTWLGRQYDHFSKSEDLPSAAWGGYESRKQAASVRQPRTSWWIPALPNAMLDDLIFLVVKTSPKNRIHRWSNICFLISDLNTRQRRKAILSGDLFFNTSFLSADGHAIQSTGKSSLALSPSPLPVLHTHPPHAIPLGQCRRNTVPIPNKCEGRAAPSSASWEQILLLQMNTCTQWGLVSRAKV